MKDTAVNLPMNEAEEIKDIAHSEDTQSTELGPEETEDQRVEENLTQQQVIEQSDNVQEEETVTENPQEQEDVVEEIPPDETSLEPAIVAEEEKEPEPALDEPVTETACTDENAETETQPEPLPDEIPTKEEDVEEPEPAQDETATETAQTEENAETETQPEPLPDEIPTKEEDVEEPEPAQDETATETAQTDEDAETETQPEPLPDEIPATEEDEELESFITIDEAAIQLEPMLKEIPTTPDNYCGDLQEAIEAGAIGMINKQDIVDELKQLIANVEQASREQVDLLKQSYYRIAKADNDELRKVFIENGGEETDFQVPEDELAPQFKELLAQFKQLKASLSEKEASRKEENYTKKLQLIDRLQALVESQGDFNKRYNEFREIQQKWKEYNPVPQEHARELWRNYQIQSERFFDLVKINNQFRDYDYKKNLELKTALCEAVEKLAHERDAISAYHQSQKLFLQWREIGPVARDVRDELWARFKTASVVVSKKHQAHFDSLRGKEEENLKAKTAICEAIEAIDFDALKSFNDWEKKTQEIIGFQKKWYAIGFATKKHNNKIFDRFRAACNIYFSKKNEFYKTLKKDFDKNLQLKRALVEKAEALKERKDWKEATKEVIDLQNEWKNAGPVSRKHSDVVWKQFISACDYFFEQKNKIFKSQKSEESVNLSTKKLLIEKINTIDKKLSDTEALMALKLLVAEWNTVGHVPFKEKDTVHKAFRTAVDKQYDRLNVAHSDRKMQQYRVALTEMTDGGQNKGRLHNERDKLMRMYERMKGELQTYENNMGFFNVSSKGGGAMLKEMENKIERLKNEMELIVKKIDAIDENFE